jgi:hypothetical protein
MHSQTTEKALNLQKKILAFKYSSENIGKFQKLIDEQAKYIDGQEIDDQVEIWNQIVKFNKSNLF